MSVAIFVTKIEMVDAKTASVVVVIDCDIGRLELDMSAQSAESDTVHILRQIQERLERFGRELAEATRPQHRLRLSTPPQLK